MRFILTFLLFLTPVVLLKGHEAKTHLKPVPNPQENPLSTDQMVKGLKEALKTGTKDAVDILNQKDGYFKDPKVKILFPSEVDYVKNKLESTGGGALIDKLVKRMNRAAEKAAEKATPIFMDAVQSMTIRDAKDILQGGDTAATHYFRKSTSRALFDAFKPDIENSLAEVGANKTWNAITTRYNKIPFSKSVETDLAAYATRKALNGLFIKLKEEEQDIRKDPKAKGKELLEEVFGPFK